MDEGRAGSSGLLIQTITQINNKVLLYSRGDYQCIQDPVIKHNGK